MVKAALFSVALHGVIVLAMRRDQMRVRPRATVEMEVVTRAPILHETPIPRETPVLHQAAVGAGAGKGVHSRVKSWAPEMKEAAKETAPAMPGPSVPEKKPDLFAPSALAAGIQRDEPSGFRPKHGVGDVNGVGVGDFLAEDAGRERAQKGLVPPSVREVERELGGYFDPPFGHVDNANRRELMHKQFMGFLKTPPKTGELKRGLDPTRETAEEKLRSTGDRAFFLGRRVLVFARQKADGTILELSIRQPSGFRAFDEDALDAVEKALRARPPRDGREVRTLWQLDATGYVVIAPEPTLKFDESTGKSEWIYPLQKRVDKAVKLLAVY